MLPELHYAGFWKRLCAAVLDLLILAPYSILIIWFSTLSNKAHWYLLIPEVVFFVVFSAYLVVRFGGTPGKLIMGIRIAKIDGSNVGWSEAIRRISVDFIIMIISSLVLAGVAGGIDNSIYVELSWSDRNRLVAERMPTFQKYLQWVENTWYWGELIVLLTNRKKRSIHDFIAGTIVIKKAT